MSHPLHHAISTQKTWGGEIEDYLPIHNWFDETKGAFADHRHRALRHHAEGIFWCEEVFGIYITNTNGRMVPVRTIGEQHVKEDLGYIPTIKDWFIHLKTQPWMLRPGEGRQNLNKIKKAQLDYKEPNNQLKNEGFNNNYPAGEALSGNSSIVENGSGEMATGAE